jgi:hypothetical protein
MSSENSETTLPACAREGGSLDRALVSIHLSFAAYHLRPFQEVVPLIAQTRRYQGTGKATG